MIPQYDVAVLGGGIVGLAHAWMAARRGLRVVLLERSAAARGASVRNFGMIWPIGQPAGELYALALRSREFWLELRERGVLPVEECGSLHLAHHADEFAVLEEFCQAGQHQAELQRAEETARKSPLVNSAGLLGGMWSQTELRINPRLASSKIAAWLTEALEVKCCFNAGITRIEDGRLHAADGREWTADQILICSGSDLRTLHPEIFLQSELQLCKLQMLKTVRQPAPQTPAAHIASGLTLRHYQAFAKCPSLPNLRARIAEESPELDRYGIHVMASQFPGGEIILGDSHEYGEHIAPFDKTHIDDLMMRELRKIIQPSDWTLEERWHGIYAKHPSLPVFEAHAADRVRIFVGTGGAGMTMAFGLADRAWKQWLGEIT